MFRSMRGKCGFERAQMIAHSLGRQLAYGPGGTKRRRVGRGQLWRHKEAPCWAGLRSPARDPASRAAAKTISAGGRGRGNPQYEWGREEWPGWRNGAEAIGGKSGTMVSAYPK